MPFEIWRLYRFIKLIRYTFGEYAAYQIVSSARFEALVKKNEKKKNFVDPLGIVAKQQPIRR